MPRSRLLFLLPPLLLLCLTLPHLGQGEFRRDTVRYAAVGHYMFSGGDPIAPALRPGVPYFNKPPLPLWIHGGFLKIVGVSLAAARLPSILAAVGVVLLSMLCVRRIASRDEALVSGFVLVLTYEFFRRTREISLDLWQLLFVMAAAYCVVRSLRIAKLPVGHFVWTGVFVGLALLCKPLIALGALPLFALWLILAARPGCAAALIGIALPVALIVALPWHVAMWARFGEAFTDQYLGRQIVGRARGELGSEGPFFYLTMSGWSLYPWLLAALGAGVWLARKPRRARERGDLVLFGATWSLLALLALSLFADKKPNYALLVWPMLSWVAAFGLCRLAVPALSRWHRSGYRGLAPAAVAASVAVALVPVDIHRGTQPGVGKVLEWMKDEGIRNDEFAAAHLYANDYCYLYLGTGRWPREDGDSARIVLNRSETLEDARLLFESGSIRLWRREGM